MDNSHNRLIFDLEKYREKKEILGRILFSREMLCHKNYTKNIALRSSQIFYVFVSRVEIAGILELKVVAIPHVIQ